MFRILTSVANAAIKQYSCSVHTLMSHALLMHTDVTWGMRKLTILAVSLGSEVLHKVVLRDGASSAV